MKMDRYTKAMLTLLVMGIWGFLIAPLLHGQPTQAQAGIRWQYTVSDDNTFTNINKYGAQGWEAFAIAADGRVVFKRRR